MKKFYLGMDIGTNSVGMACTDENYRLLRAKGKDLWAVRMFDSGETAENRRAFRTARRRLERRKQRIGFLQFLFAPYIEDKLFFIRLNNSQYYPDDKCELLGCDKNNLFADGAYTDKDYHRQFPTIYHLRLALQTEPVKDLRLYYLAIHHIIKYRGHFLFEGATEDVRSGGGLFDGLNAVCADLFAERDTAPFFPPEKVNETKEVLLNPQLKLRDKQLALEGLFGKDPLTKEIIKGICGAGVSPKALFGEEYAEEKTFSFKKLTDGELEGMQPLYGDNFALIESMRAIYSYAAFEKLLEGQPDISSAMINVYEQHKRDLALLKSFLKENASEDVYKKFFKSAAEDDNYVNYVGYTKKGGDKIKVKVLSDDKKFLLSLKKLLVSLPDVKDKNKLGEILERIDAGVFLPKILHSDNGLFPRQVNEDELVKIIANMVKTHPETAEAAEKILPVFRFRIPYYVGPLTGKNSWVVKKSDVKITPWNFDEVVDKAKSNENFMRRMTNKCTYLHSEDVLPLASVRYQKFNVLNQLNKLRIDDRPVSVGLKKRIFDELFLKKKRVTDRAITDLLVKLGEISPEERSTVKLSGKDGEFKATMSSYITFKNLLGEFAERDLACGSVCENIILWHTLNTDKNVVEELILKNYGKIPEIKKNIKALKGLSFKEFGRLSAKFLTGLKTEDGGYAGMSICDLLYETNENLNEILFNPKYGFTRLIAKENGEESGEVGYGDVEELYVSPIVRRGIWQSLVMADEYVKALGKEPDKIFIEVTRRDEEKGDGGRKASRKFRLLNCYKNISGYEDILNELQSEDVSDLKLRSERLYLYFRQLGRCMYSGERIDLSNLKTDLYDVDHILPRTYIKDDSLDNKVLVLRSKNAEKRDIYPLPENFRTQAAFWKLLLEKGLISDVTFSRLTRSEPLGEDDYNYFINRQIVITDQTVKAVAQLLKRKFPNAKIVYSKAKNVSDFRQKFDLYKCRLTNDFHHAKDAYLNAVVGNVYDTCFSTPFAMFYKNGDGWRTYNLKTMFSRDVAGAWDGNSISTVKGVYAKFSAAVTRYAYCEKGEFYNQTVYPHSDDSITAPRKENGALARTDRYGGYKSQTTAYFAVVRSENKKGGKVVTVEGVPLLVSLKCGKDAGALEKYFESEGLKNAEILVPKLKCKQLVSYNGTRLYITGVTGSKIKCINAVQLYTDNKTDEYVKALGEFYERFKGRADEMTGDGYIIKTNRFGEIRLKIDRESNIELYNLLSEKLKEKIYGGLSGFKNFANILDGGRGKFDGLSVFGQVEVLLQILNFFCCNAALSNLTLIGGSANCGSLAFNKKITDVDFRIIDLSPCGLTVRERKI